MSTYTFNINRIQNYLLNQQDKFNSTYPSSGSMNFYEVCLITNKNTNVLDTFIDEIINRLKNYDGYLNDNTESVDRENLKRYGVARIINFETDFKGIINSWIDPNDSNSSDLSPLIKELFDNDFTIYKFELSQSYIDSQYYSYYMNYALGMKFDLIVLKSECKLILLRFSNELI